MDSLFERVREECEPAVWSRGVELVRGEAVVGERESSDEVALRVALRGGLQSALVTLHLEFDEWECSCAGRDDPCEHVAAAVIALRQARKRGRALPAPERHAGRLRYRIERDAGDGLRLEREIVDGERGHPLLTTLDAIASGRVDGPGFTASEADVEVERVLGSQLSGDLPRHAWPRMLAALERCGDILLEGRPVRCSGERLPPHVRVEDAPGGFRLQLVEAPEITRRVAGDLVLCGDTLRAVSRETGLLGRELDELSRGRCFPDDEAARLVSEVLPQLRERLPVDVLTTRLPERAERIPPRIQIASEREGDGLAVLPLLVYGEPPVARVDGGRLVLLGGGLPERDEAGEQRLRAQLERELGVAPGRRVVVHGEEALKLAQRIRTLSSSGASLRGDAYARFFPAPPLEPRLSVDGHTLELDFACEWAPDEGGPRRRAKVGGEAVLAAWRAGEHWVPLLEGGLAPLPLDWLSRYGAAVADLLAAREADGRVARAALPDLAALCEELDEPAPAGLGDLAPLLAGPEALPEPELPDDLAATLRGYQRRGVAWLQAIARAGVGGLLADDMGLGKTLQALCAIRGRTLVVAPTSVLHGWAEEAARFRPAVRVCVYHGGARQLDGDADLTLTSYALLRVDVDRLCSVDWDCVVLDEAHAIKNPESQVSRAAHALRAGVRFGLTGTPVENRLEELWSLFHFLDRGLLGGRSHFRTQLAQPIAAGDAEAAERLRTRIRPFMLRRLKRDVAPELPPRTEVVLRCELSERERRTYDAVLAASREEAVRALASGGSVLPALEALLRLRQAACHPGLVPGGDEPPSSSKLELLFELVEEMASEGHRALVFSQWTSLLDRVEPGLRSRGLDFVRLDGSTRDRGAVVARFQADDGPPLMLVSLKAGGTGLNLTAADHLFLLDPWWNPAVEDQAADRAHRIGQQRPVLIHRLIASGTVEERILALQRRKRDLAEVAIGEADPASRLGRDELLDLLA